MSRTALWIGLITSTCLMFAPGAALAQQTSGIAGVLRDTSGAVLPGVTVEAASPALIDKVRPAVSGAEVRYHILELRPGTYASTFIVSGVTRVRRQGRET